VDVNFLRRALTRIYDGSAPLGWRLLERFVGARRLETLLHLGLVTAGLWIWWRLLAVWPLLTGIIAALWVVSAWRSADAEEVEEERQAAAEAARVAFLDEIYLRMIVDVIGDGPGIHLVDLLPMVERVVPELRGMEQRELRAFLEALGVPVQRKMRVGRRTGVAGVRAEDARQALADYLARHRSPEE
jgi:hypothetical protein